ncbi:MAG TPA: D-glycero-beta-D-manno-heptose-7-phosphate kinase [Flavobacteriales bacterium]|nr:D-glycero-beta-D-manno-heptose-7-phosphate kinase [Flavobacteriales bacterium]
MEALTALQNTHRISVLVIGDVMLDAYLIGQVNRISPEAPVPIVDVQKQNKRLGGAANVAMNLTALGAQVNLAAVIGDDSAGGEIQHLLDAQAIKTAALIEVPNRKTTVKTRVISNGQQLLRVDEEQSHNLEERWTEILITRCQKIMSDEHIDTVIFEDYDKGTLTPLLIESILAICSEKGIKTTVDPKFRNFNRYTKVDLFKPNLNEMQEGLGIAIHKESDVSLAQAVKRMQEQLEPSISMVTLSERGVCFYAPDHAQAFQRIPAFEREITDVSGAGDAVIAVASVLLASDVPVWQIAAVANLAGGLVCEKVGVVTVELERLKAEWDNHAKVLAALMNSK